MSDYPKAFKELEDKIQSTESNGFPTKRNHAGNQQNYVPSGDEGGQYTYDGATGKPGDEDLEPPTSSSSSSGKDTKEPKGEISVQEGDGKPTNKGFEEYIDSQGFKQDFKDQLKKDYRLGDDDSRGTLEKYVSEGAISIKRTSGLACCEMRGILKLSKESEGDDRVEGEVFWHESYHGIDFQSMKYIPQEKLKTPQYRSIFDAAIGFASASASTRYVLDSGKTMLDTLTEEITSRKRSKAWHDVSKDFQADLDGRLKKKYPDLDAAKASALRQEEIDKIWEQVNSELPSLPYEDEQYVQRNAARWKRQSELSNKSPALQRIHAYNVDKSTIKHEMFKEWGSISDMYVAGGSEAFCGGHSAGYFRKDRANKALEFFAEYGSAKATNDTKTLEKFAKYFPETTKAAEEVFAAIHKYSKKGRQA